MHDKTIRCFSGDGCHERPGRRQKNLRSPGLAVSRFKRLWHQTVLVVFAIETQRITIVKVIEDMMQRFDELAHLRGAVMPGHTKPSGDVRFDLRTQSQDEASIAKGVQIICQLSGTHWVPRESHGHGRNQFHPIGIFSGQGQGQKRVMV